MTNPLPLRIITLNIRVDLQTYRNDPNALKDNEQPWKVRLPLITKQLKQQLQHAHALHDRNAAPPATLICIQEALHHQIVDIITSLNSSNHQNGTASFSPPLWTYTGSGREDGDKIGEISPVLYRRDTFDLVRSAHTWLSETPDKPSKGWDADCIRALASVVLQHKATGQQLAAFNTHLDHRGVVARKKSVGVILEVIKRTCRTEGANGEGAILPFVLTGDFNSTPEREAYRACLNSGLALDAYDATPEARRFGPEDTFTGFEPPKHAGADGESAVGDFFDGDHKGRIDYAWFGPRVASGWEFAAYTTLPNYEEESGIYLSDHRAVIVDVTLAR
jgi:endonuclease/exonuclease/phosphatase family metal-dependent hydrolase